MSRLRAPGTRLMRPTSGLIKSVPSPSSSQRSPSLPPNNDGVNPSFKVGDRVLVGGVKEGTIAFLGTTQFASGIWAGIVLDTPDGKNNGTVKGVSYFQCPPNFGLFAKPEKLTLVSTQRPSQPTPKRGSSQSESGDYKVGNRVVVDGEKIGTVAFVGPTQFASGVWIGVALDTPDGKNNGSVKGIQYFDCPPNFGLFTRSFKLTLAQPTIGAQATAKPLSMSGGSGRVQSSSGSVEDLKSKAAQLQIGDRVIVNGVKEGTLRYIGNTHFAKGIWVGVELDDAQGKNDGSVSGKRYFQCEELHGLFAPLPKVEKVPSLIDANKDMSPPTRRFSGRGLSGSPGSSVSSLSSMGRIKQIQTETEPMSPVRSDIAGNGTLSHIMFEKDHQIATLRSSLDQSEMDKVKLSEEITELRRKTDDLQFLLEEQSVISGDKLEKFSLQENSQVSQLRQQLEEEKQKYTDIANELTKALSTVERLENEKNHKLISEDASSSVQNEVQLLLREKEQLLSELDKVRSDLAAAENDFKVTEVTAGELQNELVTVKQQLQETLDVCGQQENLLEEKVNDIQTLDEEIKQINRNLETMTSQNHALLLSNEQLTTERDNALSQCNRLMLESSSTSTEHTQLALQYKELLQERDQLKQDIQDMTALIDKISGERDDAQDALAELKTHDGKNQEISVKYDSLQSELVETQSALNRAKRESIVLNEELEQLKLTNQQKFQMSEANHLEYKQRMQQITNERDGALQDAQNLLDKYELVKHERNQLANDCNEYQKQLVEFQYQLDEVTQNYYNVTSQETSLQTQLEETEQRLELKLKELQEAKEKVTNLEEELYLYSSQGSDTQRLVALEEEKLRLEELVSKLQAQNLSIQNEDIQETLQAKDQEINFLTSVIAELQMKVDTLEELNGLGTQANTLKYTSEEDILGDSQLPPPRLFCDICDEFDLHDTADCPLQAQTDSPLHSMHHGLRSNERPYCENCEVFGHWTEECEYEETY